jgi:hypothetical protein
VRWRGWGDYRWVRCDGTVEQLLTNITNHIKFIEEKRAAM